MLQKDFEISADLFKITSLSKNLQNVPTPSKLHKSKTPLKLPSLPMRGTNHVKFRVASRIASQDLSRGMEIKSMTPVRMKKKRLLSSEHEAPLMHTSDLKLTLKSVSLDCTQVNVLNEPTISDCGSHSAADANTEGLIFVLRSIFSNRPNTVFFNYPKVLGLEKNRSRVIGASQSAVLTYNISENFRYPCILDILTQAGFTENANFTLAIQGNVKSRTYQSLQDYQKVNHFPGSSCLGRKDSMWKNIEKMAGLFRESFNFCPSTFILPEDYRKFNVERESCPKDLWILKPSNSACGKGIKLITKTSNVNISNGYVISKYIKYPHLIKGFKYDLRVYVAVTSFNPLKVYIYKEGLVRFATVPYSNKKVNIKNKCIHLTNFSINKDSPTFINNQDAEQDNYGSKWSFRALKEYYSAFSIDYDRIFADIKDIIIKTFISAEGHICSKMHKYSCKHDACYELFGFDILIDKSLKCWLLEVNIFPSLSLTSPLDTKIKYMLMTDLLNLIGVDPYRNPESIRRDSNIHVCTTKNLNINECLLSPSEVQVLAEYEEEDHRKGDFERIFPVPETLDRYKDLFNGVRTYNSLLWKYIESNRSCLKKYLKKTKNPSYI